MGRRGNRKENMKRLEKLGPNYLEHAEGSCLVTFGKTKVICAATLEYKVPNFLRGLFLCSTFMVCI